MDFAGFCLNAAANTVGGIGASALGELASNAAEAFNRVIRSADDPYYFENLKMEVEWLRAMRDANELKVRQNRTKATSDYYKQWLENVNDVLVKVGNVQAADCENVTAILEKVQMLLKHGKFEGGFLVDKPSKRVVKCKPPPPDISEFRSLQEKFQKILKLLSSDGEKAIGILGALGVGKTTIMQHLNDHEEVSKIFDIIIWIKVSRDWNEERLLRDIERRLKLNLPDTTHPDEIIESIIEELKDKKYLLLLDDVTESIELHRIGIPDNNKSSKVVLTTEFRFVCASMVQRVVEVNLLPLNEAWLMFKHIVTDQIDRPDVEPQARLVAEECHGLPLLINLVGNSFKLKESVDEWRNGLEKLRDWSEVEIRGLTEKHAIIKFCYDDLKDAKTKLCLLYAAFHPADTKISTDYLVKCWAAERFLGTIDEGRSFGEACDAGYSILRNLSNLSLLHTSKRMEHVRVNNMVRQVVLHISSEELDCKFLIGNTKTSTALLNVNNGEEAKRIFMIDAKLDQLPDNPRCSMLLSLLLQRNTALKTIPPLFFRTMKKLLVLNLYETGIHTLPQSVESLTELKALFLNYCPLIDLPLQIEQLLLLEVLDIRGCKITFIPTSIGKLIYLRCLKVSYYKPGRQNGCEEMKTEYNVISGLRRLEELVIDMISYDWWCIEATQVIQHVASLEKLTSLKVCFPKLQVLQNFLKRRTKWQGRQERTSFWFFVGRPSSKRPEILNCFDYKINRYLRYCHDGNNHNSSVSNVFPETDVLELIGHDSIKCLLDFKQGPGLNGVRGCLAEECNIMETVVDHSNASVPNILSTLEQLHLKNLPVLKSILESGLSEGSLSKLQTIVIESCPLLTKISSYGPMLAKIRKLVIKKCSMIEELIMNAVVGSMQELKILELLDMPQLRTISDDPSLAWPKFEELRICECPKLKRIPFKKENAANLKLIEGEQAWWDALKWENTEVKEYFQSNYSPKVGV
ncbi:hypothetical protein SLA2020_067700 [Shorea laevis]